MGLSENNATKAKTMFYWIWHGCWTRPDRIWSVTSKIYAEVQGKPKDVCGTYYGQSREMVGNAPILNIYFKSQWRWGLNESMWNFSTNMFWSFSFAFLVQKFLIWPRQISLNIFLEQLMAHLMHAFISLFDFVKNLIKIFEENQTTCSSATCRIIILIYSMRENSFLFLP